MSKWDSQWSPEQMRMMTQALQSKNLRKREMSQGNQTPKPVDGELIDEELSSAARGSFEIFRDTVRNSIVQNIQYDTCNYPQAMYDLAFIVRSMSPVCYRFLRTIIPMPTLNHVDDKFKDAIDGVEQMMTDIDGIPEALDRYRQSHIPENYDGGVARADDNADTPFIEDNSGTNSQIPCILGVDAMAIEPYTTDMANDNEDSRADDRPGRSRKFTYFFVYYLMPIDPLLPNCVISVIPKVNGKADLKTQEHLDRIEEMCSKSGFWVVAVSADGDNTYDRLTDSIYELIQSDGSGSRSYQEFISEMGKIRMPFITDFLHFAKCLRNRLSKHNISLDSQLAPVMAPWVSWLLGLDDCLTKMSPGAQLKDSLALRVFNLENVVKLFGTNAIHAALYFLPIVLWRVINQAQNITRDGRIQILDVAFQAARMWDHCLENSHLHEKSSKENPGPLTFVRHADVKRLLSSLVAIGFVLTLPIKRINLARLGTSGLEHLFGMTRLGTRGNNGAKRIQRQIARSTLVKRMEAQNGLCLGKSRNRNLAGTTDDVTSDGLVQIPSPETFEGRLAVYEIFLALLSGNPNPFVIRQHPAVHILKEWLKNLLDTVEDGQNNNTHETSLGALNPIPRMIAVRPLKKARPQTEPAETI
jgi:hypothetical protein